LPKIKKGVIQEDSRKWNRFAIVNLIPKKHKRNCYFNSSDVNEVTLKARGRAITTAVDTAEIVRRKFLKELKVNKIAIGTEELQREDGTKNVSTMEIKLKR